MGRVVFTVFVDFARPEEKKAGQGPARKVTMNKGESFNQVMEDNR